MAGLEEQQVTTARRLRQRQIAGSDAELVEHPGNPFRHQPFPVGGKARRQTTGGIDHVATEQQHLPWRKGWRTARDRAIDDAHGGGCFRRAKIDVTQQAQGLPTRFEREPVLVGRRGHVAELPAHRFDRRQQQAHLGVAGTRPVVLAIALLRRQAGPAHAATEVLEQLRIAVATQMLPQQQQRQGVDAGVMVRGIGDKGLMIGSDCLAQHSILEGGGFTHLHRREVGLAPERHPALLLDAPGKRPAFGVAGMIGGQPVHQLARLLEAAESAQADRLPLPARLVVSFDRQRLLELLERQFVLLELQQRLPCGPPGLELQRAHRGLLGEDEDVARPVLLPRYLHPARPTFVGIGELVALGEQEPAPLRLLELRHQLEDWAHLAARRTRHAGADHRRQCRAILLDGRRVRRAVAQRVAQLAVGVDVEGLVRSWPLHQHHAACAQGMPHAEFVPDVRVVEGEIGDDEVGDQQLLEHVGADVAGTLLLVSAKHLHPRRLERRPDVFGVDAIEIDQLAIGPGLAAEGHGYEGVCLHRHLLSATLGWRWRQPARRRRSWRGAPGTARPPGTGRCIASRQRLQRAVGPLTGARPDLLDQRDQTIGGELPPRLATGHPASIAEA
ncbi:MAG: hypothetical protein FAZ92_03471 [Accumulibacter sp.]|nr:MAG: hypothetical protein FAZ92_03471 [Accumulibacter sp.]